MKHKNSFQLPKGMRDLLPAEARAKRKLENCLVNKFLSWGYEEVSTPVLEYYENLHPAETPEDQFFKFVDREGQILALRTDMTTPIARMTASQFSPRDYPLKFFYLTRVFRYENIQMGRQREFFQGGVEFIGSKGAAADGEVIALAAEILKESGLTDFQISLGHRDFLRGIIDELELDKDDEMEVLEAVWKKDYVKLETILNRIPAAPDLKEVILILPTLRGDIGVIHQASKVTKNPISQAALENLSEIYRLLKIYDVEEHVFIDFGIARDFDYYSGIIFEGYSPNVGAPILGGGRYDDLLDHYGAPAPATGFAIGLERLMLALGEAEHDPDALDYLIICHDLAAGIKKAQDLRRRGFTVRVAFSKKEALPRAKEVIEL